MVSRYCKALKQSFSEKRNRRPKAPASIESGSPLAETDERAVDDPERKRLASRSAETSFRFVVGGEELVEAIELPSDRASRHVGVAESAVIGSVTDGGEKRFEGAHWMSFLSVRV